MFYSTVLLAATAFTAAVSAQNYSTSGNNLTITPDSVDFNTRQSWCRAQLNSCPLICGGQASPNTCNPNDLTFGCTCTNGNTPNITDYDQTIPSFICAQWKADCVQAHPNDLDGQTDCLSVTCGDRNASSGTSSSSSASSSSATATASLTSTASSSEASETGSSSGSESASATSSGAAESASSSSAASAMNIASNYGSGILAAGILAAFGLAL